jgi:hypothetical protein
MEQVKESVSQRLAYCLHKTRNEEVHSIVFHSTITVLRIGDWIRGLVRRNGQDKFEKESSKAKAAWRFLAPLGGRGDDPPVSQMYKFLL